MTLEGKVALVTGGGSAEAFQAGIPRANTWRYGKPRLGASALGTQRPTADRSGAGRTFAPERTRRNVGVPARGLSLART
jgi:hypothetical protein